MTIKIDGRTGGGGLRRIHTPPKLSHDDARDILNHVAQGRTLKWCAREYKVCDYTVYRALRRLHKPSPPTLPLPDCGVHYTERQMLVYGRQCRDYALQLEELKK